MKDELQGIQGAAMVLRPEEPYRHLPEESEDNQENSVQNCLLNLSFFPMWWMANLAETCRWGSIQNIVVVDSIYCDSYYQKHNSDQSS